MSESGDSVGVPAIKEQVRSFWEDGSCGEVYATGANQRERFQSQAVARYVLEPYLPAFARFHEGAGLDVLEIGVGMGADHVEWARYGPKTLTGIDLTERALHHTRARLELYERTSRLLVGDAENLTFPDNSFDLVYSWGVLHHSPDTPRAVREVFRVLRPGGRARVMIYHSRSLVGYMLWLRYGLVAGRPRTSLTQIYAEHLESPGTKAYTVPQAREMFSDFSSITVRSQLSFGDLLEGSVGQRHRGLPLTIAKKLWPRPLIRRVLRRHGLALLIDAVK